MKRGTIKRHTPLKARTGLKTRATGQISGNKRKITKASAKRRKRGEWSTRTADTTFSVHIRQRDKKCLRCGIKEYLSCSHYHRRGHSATRFDEENCITLCYGPYSNKCHETWEGPKNEYTEFMVNRLGQEAFIKLSIRAGTTVKRSDEVAKWKEKYQKLLETL